MMHGQKNIKLHNNFVRHTGLNYGTRPFVNCTSE